jgi:hypothetical protein
VLCCLLLAGCGKTPGDAKGRADSLAVNDTTRAGDPLDQFVDYTVVEDKSLTASYYERPDIKEWYTQRVLPPPFDTTMDLSGKSYLELRLLRNEIYARNGYLFKDAALRGYFNTFDWYQPLFDVPGFRLQINAQEKVLLDKVTARETEELRNSTTSVEGNTMVDMNHVVNLVLYKGLHDSLRAALKRMNMAIVPAAREQLFYVYDENQYGSVPNFITSDVYLQVLHKYLSGLMKGIEDRTLIHTVTSLTRALYGKSRDLSAATADPKIRAAATWANTYVAIALTAMSGSRVQVHPAMSGVYKSEIGRILDAHGDRSEFLNRELFDYSQFMPRGYYTDDDARRGYFRCMKWLNSARMNVDDDASFQASLLLAFWINEDDSCRMNYSTLNGIITCLAGEEDGLSLGVLASLLMRHQLHSLEGLFTPENLETLRSELKAADASRLQPKGGTEPARAELSRKGVLFTAGRYSLDAEALLRLVHVSRPDPRRPFPRGLDVFAALGSSTAENILIGTYHEDRQWPAYTESLAAVKKYCAQYNQWDASLYTKTLECIHTLNAPVAPDGPLFMRTPYWQEKNLYTALAAWTELKHDMILYSEQPLAAEAGEGGGPEPPVHLSYVEPNLPFWTGVLDLLAYQEKSLSALGALTEEAGSLNLQLRDLATFLLAISRKEMAKERLSVKEFSELSWIGGKIESLTFQALGSDHLPERERQVALAADVYSCNGRFLEECVGLADEIYVIAEINGLPYLTRGASFSYYEFQSDSRLSDEEWQGMLGKPDRPGRPEWTRELYVDSSFAGGKQGFGRFAYDDHH